MRRTLGRLLLAFVFVMAMALVSQAKADGTTVKLAPKGLPANSIHVEGLGAGILYSINYERVLPHDIGLRLGFGFITMDSSLDDATPRGPSDPNDTQDNSDAELVSASATLISVPISVTYLGIKSKSNRHILELGLGTTVLIAGGKISF